jgi:hypothetical protein
MADPTASPLPAAATRGEALLIAAARAGEVAELAALPPAGRVVRGTLLAALLAGDNADGRRTPVGVRLGGALVAGPVLLDGLGNGGVAAAPLWLRHCWPAEGAGIPFLARGASFAELDLSHSRLARLEARGLHCAALTLIGVAIATGDGRVDLEGARLTGPAFLAGIGPVEENQGWPLLNLAGARIAGHLRLAGARLRELVLLSTVVHGDVQLDGAQLHARGEEPALLGNTARISGALRLQGAQVQGQVRLLRAEVGGAVLLGHGARLHLPGGVALLADGATLGGGLLLQDGSEVAGEIRALGARLGAGVVLDAGARVAMLGGDALALDGAVLAGGVLLAGARLDGSLSLRGARLGGDLALTAGSLVQAPHQAAVAAGEAVIGGNVLLHGATLLGRLDLAGASIGGALRAEGLDLAAGPGLLTALDGAGLRAGAVTLGGARVAGQLRLDRAELAEGLELSGLALVAAPAAAGAVPLADPEVLLSLRDARLGERLAVTGLPAETEGVFDLRGATVAALADAGGAGWGVSAGHGGVRLRLDGFAFRTLAEVPGGRAGRDMRLGYLLRQFRGGRPNAAEFCGPAFTQVAQALRRGGHGADADWFARARRRVRRRAGVTERPLGAWADGLAGMFFGDFYSARRTLGTFALYLLLGAGGLWAANIQGVLVARGADAAPCWMAEDLPQVRVMDGAWPMPDRSAGLEALRMATDLAIPGIPLHWAERCAVVGDSVQAVAWGWAWRLYQWLGGALLLLGAAGLTGLFRRD